MSKVTHSQVVTRSVIVGGLLTAATLVTAAVIRRRSEAMASADALVCSCEKALNRLSEISQHVTA